MRVLISGATDGLGQALVFEMLRRYPEAQIVGFSRTAQKIEAMNVELAEKFPEDADRVRIIQGDISSNDAIIEVLAYVQKILGGVDVLVNNVGVFDFDDNLSPIPEEDWQLQPEIFKAKHRSDLDFAAKERAYRMVQTNFAGNRKLLGAVINLAKMNGTVLEVLDVGSVGVVADLAKKPLGGTDFYGRTKGELAKHSVEAAREHDFVHVAIVHPGPFGRSAQAIADKFGDTYAVDVEEVAKHALDLFDQLSENEPVVQGIIASDKHFSWDVFGDVDALGLEGLREDRSVRVPEERSRHLLRQNQ